MRERNFNNCGFCYPNQNMNFKEENVKISQHGAAGAVVLCLVRERLRNIGEHKRISEAQMGEKRKISKRSFETSKSPTSKGMHVNIHLD